MHTLKEPDMFPNDINWENLNVTKKERIFRTFLSYFFLIIFIIVYLLIILVISRIQGTFQRKYNLLTDCSNVDYENNNNIIYKESMDENQNEKEKIYSYCYCQSDLNGKTINYNNIIFDPCKNYNKYKYQRRAFIYILSAVLTIIDFFVDPIVEKIIHFQKFESKSNEDNLNIIISSIILIFNTMISIILINSRFNVKYISFFIFGQFEDITPQWITEVGTILINNFDFYFGTHLFILCLKSLNCCEKLKKIISHVTLFFLEQPITHFYEFFKRYAPKKDFKDFSLYIIPLQFSFIPLIFSNSCFVMSSFLIFMFSFYFLIGSGILQIKQSYSYNFNKRYFSIMFFSLNIMLTLRLVIGIWWYSSEYYFIDINEEVYKDFFYPNKILIDKFLRGNASITEKIIAKLLLKRNLLFIIPLMIIIVTELIYLIYKLCKKKSTSYLEELISTELYLNPCNSIDIYANIKKYELWKLYFYKINNIYLYNCSSCDELKDYILKKVDNIGKNIISLGNLQSNEDRHEIILLLKKKLKNENSVEIYLPNYTYSPFLLDEYSIPFTLKYILSPYYT